MGVETRTYRQPTMFMGSYKLRMTKYPATAEGKKAALLRLSSELSSSRSASIITGELGIFKTPSFISVLRTACSTGRPHIDLVFYCECIIQALAESGRGSEKPTQLLLGAARDIWRSEPQLGIDPEEGAAILAEAVDKGLLRLYVAPERVQDTPHSTILDNRRLMIQQVHPPNEYSKMWFVENPAGLDHKYLAEHTALKKRATALA